MRLLVIEGNAKQRRDADYALGYCCGSDRYQKILKSILPNAIVDVAFPADGHLDIQLSDYSGVIIGGSGLNIPGNNECPQVRHQIEFASAVFANGLPFFGSCWGLQVAAAAAGGQVGVNPKGREMGFARKISLTAAGQESPLFLGKPGPFDAPAIHVDEVTHLPSGGVVLASNSHSSVQAASIRYLNGEFWGVQYHPEFNLEHMANLTELFDQMVLNEGFYENDASLKHHVQQLKTLHKHPTRFDLAWVLGLDQDVIDDGLREREVQNWIDHQVVPSLA